MHSFFLLTLVSSAFAIPISIENNGGVVAKRGDGGKVVNVPANVAAPIVAAPYVDSKVYAPVKAAVGNVDVSKVNALNNVASGNKIASRDGGKVVNVPVDVDAPIKAVPYVYSTVDAPVKAAAANVDVNKVNALNGVVSGNKIASRDGSKVVDVPVDANAPVKVIGYVDSKVYAPVEAAVGNVDVSKVNALNNVASGNKIASRDGGKVANVPVDVDAPIKAVPYVYSTVDAPVKAAAANVDVNKVNALNGVVSGNKIASRDGGKVVDVPVDVDAPIKAVPYVYSTVDAPIKAAAANVDVSKVNALNGVVSGNKIASRDGGKVVDVPVDVDAPIKAVPYVYSTVDAPVKAAVANVDASKVYAGNNVASGNTILSREGGKVANVPVDVDAPIKAVPYVDSKVGVPVDAAAANVKATYVNAGNKVVSGNNIARQASVSGLDASN